MGLSRIFRAVAVRRPSTIVEGAEGRSKRPRRSARRGVILLGALLGAYMVLGPGVSSGAVTCAYTAATQTVDVNLAANDDDVVLRVSGGVIQFSDDGVTFAACGIADVTNTDLINVTDTGGAFTNTDVTINLLNAFAPGNTNEGGSSDEIEFQINLGADAGDDFIIVGAAGNDSVTFGAGGVNLNAAEADGIDADVTFISAAATYTFNGGTGNDVANGNGGDGTGASFGTALTLNGETDDDNLTGTVFADTINGNDGDDDLFGADTSAPFGDVGDTINGGIGADAIDGFSGNDTINGGAGNDVIIGGEDNDTVDAGPGDDQILAAFDNPGITLTNNDTLLGGDGNDIISAGGGDDGVTGVPAGLVNGGNGQDTLNGQGGNDTLLGGAGNDLLTGGSGNDSENGEAGADTYNQEALANGNDAISTSGGGSDTGSDTVDYSASADDVAIDLTVANGDGRLVAGENDNVQGDVEILLGGAGNDGLTGDGDGELLVGNAGDDTLTGGSGDDTLRGGADNDITTLNGGVGDDLLDGGPGNDTENGNDGNDVFIQGNQQLFASTDVPKTIPPSGTGAAACTPGVAQLDSVIIVGPSGEIRDLDVRLDIEHAFDEDLDVTLTHGLTSVSLFTDVGDVGDNFRNTVLDDEATAAITAGSADFNGRFRPEAPATLTSFDGLEMAGTWTLTICDDVAADVGSLNAWSLEITTASASANGNDTLDGGDPAGNSATGAGDLVDYSGRTVDLNVTIGVGVNDGQFGETDNVGFGVDHVKGGSGLDSLTGDGNGNILEGNAGNDDLNGLSGIDRLEGGLGDDNLNGGPGNDVENGNDGNDLFDQEAAANGSDVLDGGNPAGNAITGVGDTVDYSARPAANPVTVTIGLGADDGDPLANGGTGEDDNVTSGTDHVLGSPGDDSLTGDGNGNRLVGNDGDDFLDGLAGVDLLDGGNGEDTGEGGDGNDTINLGAGDDHAFGEAGNDTIDGGPGDDNDLNGGVDDDFIRGGTGNDIANGDDGDDAVSGDEGDDTLSGNTLASGTNDVEGTPTISPDCGTTGGAYPIDPPCQPDGDTVVYFFDPGTVLVTLDPSGAPNNGQATDGFGDTDTLRGISATDSTFENVHGSGVFASGDVITGDDTPNFVFGEDGDDDIFGLGGNDTLLGQGGDDEIHGQAGDDTLDGGTTGETDGDILSYDDSASSASVDLALQPGVVGGGAALGADTARNFENINGSLGNDNVAFDPLGATPPGPITGLNGDANENIIFGDAGNDRIRGANGNDVELGGTGNDFFDQEFDINGADVLTGGPPGTPPGDTVSYINRDDPVNVNQNGIADDGEEGEGDNVTEMETVLLPRIFVIPEGATHSGFTTFLLLANPGLDDACVRITFLGPNGPLGTLPEEPVCDTSDNNDGIEILSLRRRTVNINTSLVLIGSPTPLTDVATRVFQTSGSGQVVGEVSLQKAGSLAAMNMVGTDSASNITREATWLVPEGATHSGFATFVTIANPNTSLDTHVDVDFLTGSAGVVDGPDNLLVPAGARRTVTVNAPLASGGCGCADDVSTQITVLGDEPEVVVGMSIHRQLGADLGIGGSLGLTSAEDTWVVPEGATHSGFTTFVLLANPGVSPATVGVTYLTGSQGPVPDTPVTIPAGGRTTLSVNARLAALGKNPDDVSTLIDATSGLVAVESTIQKADSTGFVIADSVARGGSDATDAVSGPDCRGLPLPCWLAPEGATHSGFVTFILVANPLPVNAEVDFAFLTPAGLIDGPQNFVITPGTRRTITVNNFVLGQDVSTLVFVDQGGVVVEMSIDRVAGPPGPGDGFSKGRSLAFNPFFFFFDD